MSNSNPTNIYCKSGTFTCSCCNYTTTIYSDTEWAKVEEEIFCDECKTDTAPNTFIGIIYRDDLDPNEPLHPQCTYIHVDKNICSNCKKEEHKIHWTEQKVNCPNCNQDSLVFTEYNIGANMLQFYECCVDALKPSLSPMEWIDEHGHSIFVVKGPGDKFSAT